MALEKEFYSQAELAELLGVSEKTLYRAVQSGELAYYRVGRQKRFRREDIEEYLSKLKERRKPNPSS